MHYKGCELAAFEITLNEKNVIFCTAYRVNNLGKENHDSILKVRNPRKIFIIGDFNVSSISWPLLENQCSSNPIEKLLLNRLLKKA